MSASKQELWGHFQARYDHYPTLGLAVDLSRVDFPDDYFKSMGPRMNAAFAAMHDLERGAIANPDEKRMVGHYWLRNPALAPTPEISRAITDTLAAIHEFTEQVHSGKVRGANGPFQNLLLIGIGGSALGPQFVSRALGHPARDKMKLSFLDN